MTAGRSRLLLLTAAAALAGCGSAFSTAPGGLAYDRPDPNPATYVFGDTATFTIETAMGPMDVVTAHGGTAELDFRRWRRDSEVVVRFPRFQGSFQNRTQAASRVDASAIGGPFTVRLTPDGRVAVVDTPALGDRLLDIVAPDELVRPLFVHLPNGPVQRGTTWADTVTTTSGRAGTRTEARTIVVSTLAGDTVVAGRRLLLIRTESRSVVRVTGVSGGVDVTQELTGGTTGTVLWDERSKLLVERRSAGELSGTLTLPGVDVEPMPVRVVVHRVVRLRD